MAESPQDTITDTSPEAVPNDVTGGVTGDATGEIIPGDDQELPPELVQRHTPTAAIGPSILKEHYLIDPSSPIPHLDSPSAKAFAVEDRRDLSQKLFGLICTPGLPPRIELMRFFRKEKIPGLLRLVNWGVVDWPPLGQRTMVVIYERPMGGRVLDRIAKKEAKITEYDIRARIIEPFTETIRAMNEKEQPFRCFRPQNLFFLDEAMEEIVLGDCVTAPPAFDQSPQFESIERAMCMPVGRGRGDQFDDVFAFGVSLIHLTLGYDPVSKMKPEDVIQARLATGSYATLCGQTRIPLALMEPIRGMLADERMERWAVADVINWLDGKQMTPIQKRAILKADSPYIFMGHAYYSDRTIAHKFIQHPKEALIAANDEAFQNWLVRSLGRENAAERIQSIVQAAVFHKNGYQGTEEFMLSKIVSTLDSQAPIQYKGLSFMPDGFGAVIAYELLRDGNMDASAEILSYEIASVWLDSQPSPLPTTPHLKKAFTQLRSMLSMQDLGFGMERVLYELCRTIPCQSPIVLKEYVIDIEDILPALDRAATEIDGSTQPIDRHIVAYICVQFDQDVGPHIKALANPNEETALIGMLSLLAFIQWKLQIPSLLALSSWVGGIITPSIETYHNRETRQDIEKELPKLVRQGNLPEIFELIDNSERRQDDNEGYEEAIINYTNSQNEIDDIQGSGDERQIRTIRNGQQAAAVISIVLMFIVISVLLIIELF